MGLAREISQEGVALSVDVVGNTPGNGGASATRGNTTLPNTSRKGLKLPADNKPQVRRKVQGFTRRPQGPRVFYFLQVAPGVVCTDIGDELAVE